MRRELRDLRKTVDVLRDQVDELMEHRRQQMDVPPASEEEVENSRVTRRTLKSIRKKFDLAQDELAELLDVSTGTISLWETGESKPQDRNKARIITLREMDKDRVDDILDREDDRGEWNGQTLKKKRKERGMTQAELADALDVASNTISGWESDRMAPSAKNMQKLREILEKAPEEVEEETGAAARREFDGERLTEMKKKFDINQGELAELLGVAGGTIWSWETGNSTPSKKNMQKIREVEQKSKKAVQEELEAAEEEESEA
jgi:transcriptional regulator with XRE-family HTH domain